MSFILDALKKSESERNRQAGPALLEVRVAPRRARLPLWAVIIVAALALNLLVIGTVLWRGRSAAPVAASVPAQTATQTATQGAAAPVATAAPPPVVVTAPAATLPDPALARTPLPAAAAESAVPENPADFAPALPARGPRPATTADTAAADLGLPTLNDLNASGANLPPLRLSLHVYDADPARRYVLLNSTRLREGESTPDGIRLDRITEAGAILAWRGRRFTIPRGE